jgi:3-hydroxybutyryl-CoA dehydrogenase
MSAATPSLDRAGVVGLGTMGAGIVEVFARTGLPVVAVEINDEALSRGRGILEGSVQRALDKGRLSADDASALLGRVTWTTSFDDLAEVDLVIEAIPERLELKVDLFTTLDALCKPSTILATNTSSLSVTRIAAATGRPGRVIGMHFFNPAPVMKLVEVITTVLTDADVADLVRDLSTRCGKTPVVVGDRAGFVANTLLIGYLNDAVRLFEETSVSRDDLDAAMRLGAGLPMGPLALCDLIGLDVVLEIVDVLFAESRDPVHAAAPLLRSMVAAGLLGRKSGRGFYTYAGPGSGRIDEVADETPAVTLPGRTVVVGRTSHADELLADAAKADVALAATSIDAPDLDGADLVLVEVSPLHSVRDFALAHADIRERIVGIHPLHRGPNGLLVEVVRTPFTSDDAVAAACAIARAADAVPAVCDDRAGLVVGRLLTVYLNDAARMVDSGYASPDDVDAAMTLGCGYPVGPMAFLSRMGASSVVSTLDRVLAETALGRHAAVPLLSDAAAYGVPISELAR